MKRHHHLLGILLGLGCLYLAFRGVRWEDLREALLAADYRLVPLFILLHLGGMLVRMVRWRLLLLPLARVGFGHLFSALSVGFMANFLFPARAGEFLRAYLLGRTSGLGLSPSLATIVLERVFDGLTILILMGITPFFLSPSPGHGEILGSIKTAGILALGAYVVLVAVLILALRREDLFHALVERAGKPLPARYREILGRTVSSFVGGLHVLGRPAHLAGIALLSFLLWALMALANGVILGAFGLSLPLFAPFFLLVMQSLGVMAPTPGFVGALQYAHVLALAVYGVGKEVALPLGILVHALLFLTYVGLGAVCLLSEGVSLGEMRRAGSSREGAGS